MSFLQGGGFGFFFCNAFTQATSTRHTSFKWTSDILEQVRRRRRRQQLLPWIYLHAYFHPHSLILHPELRQSHPYDFVNNFHPHFSLLSEINKNTKKKISSSNLQRGNCVSNVSVSPPLIAFFSCNRFLFKGRKKKRLGHSTDTHTYTECTDVYIFTWSINNPKMDVEGGGEEARVCIR